MAIMPDQQWVFQGQLVRVIDGDTADLELDVGMHGRRIERLRLFGIDCPERRGDTKAAGDAATVYALAWCMRAAQSAMGLVYADWPLFVQTFKSDAFGRYLALVWNRTSGACLNDDLLATGHAVVYR